MFQGSGGEQSGVRPCWTLWKQGKGLSVVCLGLCPCRVLLCEVCPYVHWDMLHAWFTEGQVLSPAELGEEPAALTQCSLLQQ